MQIDNCNSYLSILKLQIIKLMHVAQLPLFVLIKWWYIKHKHVDERWHFNLVDEYAHCKIEKLFLILSLFFLYLA